MEYSPPTGYLIRMSVQRFVTMCVLLTGLVILVRLYEIGMISGKAGYPSGSFFLVLYGIRYDIVLALRISAFLLIPYVLIDFISPSVAKVLFAIASLTTVISEVILLQYFAVHKLPLAVDGTGFSLSNISLAINGSGGFTTLNVIVLVAFILIGAGAFIRWSDLKFSSQFTSWITVLAILSLLPFDIFNPDRIDFRNDFRKNITANKLNLYSTSACDKRFGENSFYLFITNTTKKTENVRTSN